ncbi:hypothetical protein AEA09_00090 [Lysinibacillus contaminans]|uniref:DUF2892 domain-containing protein n=1 Tax=Lysinibacillus contaminans TaxID=1293441 RepID=A0ABR5K4X0_9BACI|nr:DUF2892 domain-containing protein [Lysinibacillus contaminans]KOS71452.1 hypothetical protein AEA09_00090 [Lysinibacillus contaminans]
MQQSNLSDRNAFCRFMVGTSMTAFGIAKVSRNSDCLSGKLMITLGAMKMAEGIFKYCPTKAMLNTNMQSAMTTTMQSMFSGQNSITPENISKLMQDFSSAFSSSNTDTKSGSTQTSDTDAETNKQNSSDTKKNNNTETNKQNSSDTKNSTNNSQNPS